MGSTVAASCGQIDSSPLSESTAIVAAGRRMMALIMSAPAVHVPRPGPLSMARRGPLGARSIGEDPGGGIGDFDERALAGLARDGECCSVRLGQRLGQGQPEPGAFDIGPCGAGHALKWFQRALDLLLIHSNARI